MKCGSLCLRNDLRYHCFVIGYMNLLASIVDITCHVLIAGIASNGFQCDTNIDNLRGFNWPWLEPILLIINIGTHGFYPFPLTFRFNNYADFNPMMSQELRCYPGMVHIYLIDVLNFTINAIWLKFVISFVRALHKKNPEPMRVFFGLSLVKLIMQIMYFAYQPNLYAGMPKNSDWFIKIVDFSTASVFLIIINKYIRLLNQERERTPKIIDQPPSYVECLMSTNKSEPNGPENSDQVAVIVVSNEAHEIGEGKKENSLKVTKK